MSLDDTTIRGVESARESAILPGPALTILFHPDVRRVGQIVRLSRLGELSRVAPKFSAHGEKGGLPLTDRGLSRKPLSLQTLSDGGYRISPPSGGGPVRVDGEPLLTAEDVNRDELERGVVIQLSNRVVLLWHMAGPPREFVDDLGIVGHSHRIVELRDDLLRVADLSHSVLIVGESGSGKELVARAIHRASARRDGPCICVNMATIPPATAASQLFGHTRGAFTGAGAAHTGFFTRSSGGTMFLDEIGDTPLDVQAMLLRAIETGEIFPLGAETPQSVDVRFVAATDADLSQAVSDGVFREQLLHRLSSYVLVVPPLRERREDIGRLFFHFLRRELDFIGELDRLKPPKAVESTWIPASLVAQLARFDWPGNVRQLRNVARQLAVANRGESRFRTPPALSRLLDSPAVPEPTPRGERSESGSISEDELIAALRECRWQPSRTAAYLGISRSALYNLMNRSKRIRKARDYNLEQIAACAEECMGDLDAMAEKLELSKRGLQLRMAELGLGGRG